MNCYLDSSVVLRILFEEPDPLKEWPKIRHGFSSRLLRIECMRTIDRLRGRQRLSSEEALQVVETAQALLTHIGIVPLTSTVLSRSEQPFLNPLGTLDALHLSTALLWRETRGDDFVFATHDRELALAAQTHGFKVIGAL